MATATLSAGGLLGTHLLIALGAKTEDLSIPPGPNRALKLISLHAYDADKMIMKLAYPAVGNWPESQIWRWQIGSDRVEEVRDGLPE
jgi:hypothetical protein